MIRNEVCSLMYQVLNDNVTRSCTCLVILSTTIIGIFYSYLSAAVIFGNYILGFIVCGAIIKYQSKTSIYLQRFASFYRIHVSSTQIYGKSCSVCHDKSCRRHKSNSFRPWKNLLVSKELNDAVEHFYNTILENFIISWYKSFTNDLMFINELRISLRYASASLVSRILEIDTGKVITKQLIPCIIKHIDDYLCMQQIAKLKNVEVNSVAVDYLGKRLHTAATSRVNELSYLRHLTAQLLPQVLPKECLQCKNHYVLMREIIAGWVLLPLMDVIADPNMINSLVILLATYKHKGHHALSKNNNKVEFLHNFTNKDMKQSAFACNLKTVLKSTDLLYAFMQFLKKEGPVHILQFCLDIEDFNNKLLTPDMSKKQLENLHTEAMNLFKIYFDRKSEDCISCPSHIGLQFEQLLHEGVYNVAKLRTSEPLYQAYDYAYNILEKDLLPGFFHSNEFYSYICGSKITATYSKLPLGTKSPVHTFGSPSKMRGRKRYEPSNPGAVSKISSGFGRIKGVLKPNQPIEGEFCAGDLPIYSSNSTAFVEGIILPNYDSIYRDLSAWRISIPTVDVQQIGSKPSYIYNINVQRIDSVSENEIRHWTIQRKDQDFYTLKNKLIEFHGENEICDSPLPSRKVSTAMETRRTKYEHFLQSLLQKPSLRGSDLLHTFLTSDQDFTYIVTASVPVVEDLGNIYQSVAFKLRKEKGQHLDSFMNTFLASTGKSKHSKFEWAEMGDEIETILPDFDVPSTPATFPSKVFNDNFGITCKRVEECSSTSFNPNGVTESLFYLLKHIFKIRQSFLRLYAAICSVAQQAVESICRLYIDRKLRSSLSESNLKSLVNLLEEIIFDTNHSTTAADLKKRKERAYKELEQAIPHLLQKLVGNNFVTGLLYVLDILQNPLCNKQLTYTLLDIIVTEVYPQITSN